MNRNLSHATFFLSLIIFSGFPPLWINPVSGQDIPGSDSIRVEELLVMDTIDLEFNGPSNEVAFYLNGMVFLSNSKYHQKMIADHITFGVVKAYFVPLDFVSLESSRPLFANDNFPYSPAGMSFSRDYKTVYFTKSIELQEKQRIEKIFKMPILDGNASAYEQLSFTSGPSRYMHPAVSIDESFMIFSSDRTPSKGGLDLFISRKTSDGWSAPETIGAQINTSSHEWYPYLDHQNNLYFSSSGHMGFGGYDVYVCYFNGTGWDRPQNLTSYINTPMDELAFSIHPNNQMALFTRVNGMKTNGEVFSVNLNERALRTAGDNAAKRNDIALLFKDLIGSGYMDGEFTATGRLASNPLVISTPLIVDKKEKAESGDLKTEPQTASEPAKPFTLPFEEKNIETEPNTTAAAPKPDPNRLSFRVQILSSTKANTKPKVTIEGKSYQTFEYYYKGAYRITVGDFADLDEANAFRTKCKNSGFNQAWVAAFRGNERETDPSVFRK